MILTVKPFAASKSVHDLRRGRRELQNSKSSQFQNHQKLKRNMEFRFNGSKTKTDFKFLLYQYLAFAHLLKLKVKNCFFNNLVNLSFIFGIFFNIFKVNYFCKVRFLFFDCLKILDKFLA